MCWREAISPLHVPVGVRCSEEIASPDCYQARNDEKEVFARNGVVMLKACNDEKGGARNDGRGEQFL